MAESQHYSLHVNGSLHEVRDAWIGESLLYVVRERLGLMGSKGACEQGVCSHDQTRCAEPALHRPELDEGLLHVTR